MREFHPGTQAGSEKRGKTRAREGTVGGKQYAGSERGERGVVAAAARTRVCGVRWEKNEMR